MKLLLDTHLVIWATVAQERLSVQAREAISDLNNALYFSVVNIWEIAIKASLQKPDFNVDARVVRRALLDAGYIELPVTSGHAVGVGQLPWHHNDPFDRLLLAQATVEGMPLLTADSALARYAAPVRLV
jgi:PIN domain nuclease of toxin-antitoxin system